MKITLSVIVAGGMRGSHNMPLMPALLNTGTSYFDGPPIVGCAALAEHGGKLTEPPDCFAHPFWKSVHDRIAGKAMDMRHQGFFGAAMLPMSELEYPGITERMAALDQHFRLRT
jgi:fructose 1,6-bisphosphate aldolase/phosphatase